MTKENPAQLVGRVAVASCLHVREGDLLLVRGAPAHRDAMLAATREAYRLGARYVWNLFYDDYMGRAYVDCVDGRWLDEQPRLLKELWKTAAEERWLQLMFYGDEDPFFMEGADADRLARTSRAASLARKPYTDVLMGFQVPWLIVPYSTDAFARAALDDAGATAESFWPELLSLMRLDGAEPEADIQAHFARLSARAARLEALHLAALRFRGPGTDLRIGLSPRSRWASGEMPIAGGRRSVVNLPSEEVFSTPDCHDVEGLVHCTRPVMVMDMVVEGAWFRFKDGVVVESGADRNVAALESFLRIDEGARRLGEVALVDTGSPVWKTGRLYRNTLLDENAACHIALGHGIKATFDGAGSMTEADLLASGCNVSLQHVDVMVGSGEVRVEGLTAGGGEIPIIVDGSFVI